MKSKITYDMALSLGLTKVCSTCKLELEISKFRKHSGRGRYGAYSICKSCSSTYSSTNAHKYSDSRRKYQRDRLNLSRDGMTKMCCKCNVTYDMSKFTLNITTNRYSKLCIDCQIPKIKSKIIVKHGEQYYPCNTCYECKPISEYYKNSKMIDGVVHTCKLCCSIKNKSRYIENKDTMLNRSKQYYHNIKDTDKFKSRTIRNVYNGEYQKQYRSNNKQYYYDYIRHPINRKRITARHIERYHTESDFKIATLLRGRIRRAIQNNNGTKSARTLELLGCSILEFKTHLQNTAIQNGYLNFDINNYLGIEYHIDHIIPCESFNLSNPEDQMKCFHWSNHQILTASQNLSKGYKIL